MLPRANFFLEMPSLNFEVSYDTVPGWTLKGSVTQFLNFEGFCDTVRPNLRIAKLVSCVHLLLLCCFWGWKKQKPLNVLVGREMKDKSLKETKWRQKFKLANWSALGLEPQRTPVWRGWVKYHKPQMFSTNSLILEMNICCQWIRGVMRNVKQGNLEPDKNQPDKPHWNQQEIVQFLIWTFQPKTCLTDNCLLWR